MKTYFFDPQLKAQLIAVSWASKFEPRKRANTPVFTLLPTHLMKEAKVKIGSN
jgi:hypothetical protein